MYELIITEKPQAAKKIAEALADGKPVKKMEGGVPYYDISHGKRDIVVSCAVGHLYSLDEKKKAGWTYPVFDIEWKPTSEIDKHSAYTKKYLNVIKKLSKDADEFTIATDYDVEGEVIGVNVVRLACKQKTAKRMKFSTLTKPDLVYSYEHKLPTFDVGLALAGETRHFLDYYYGINLSRALTHSVKAAGSFKVLSIGRVQGPTLKIVVDREKEIKAFVPKPFWQVELKGQVKEGGITALHEKDKFWDQSEAKAAHAKAKGHDGAIARIDKNEFQQPPPHPFDLTTLQTEAFRALHIQPKATLELAQELYIGGFISYPRTSSQQLPPEIGYAKILGALQKQEAYAKQCAELLKKKLQPRNGSKVDPAHPAIYPTGIVPSSDGRAARLYDLIVKRFLATFGEPALRETMNLTIAVNGENFVAQGTRTIERGWHAYYDPYTPFKETELPQVKQGDSVKANELNLLSKETQPPKRYTPASIIRELEKRNLGTKATRAQVIDTLFQRGYIVGEPLAATVLGIHTIDTLVTYSEKIVDEELTRHFEEEMDDIQAKRKESKTVLSEAKTC
ncbi:MAG: DNA topoisomerase I [Nanoarchaeota archaeon]